MDNYYKVDERINGYLVRKIIGEGRYGIAYLVTNDQNERFVLKQLKKEMIQDTKDNLFYEEKTLRNLDNPHFPKFISKYEDKDVEGYILEYIDGVVFEDLIVEDKYTFSRDEIYKVGSQLLELVEILQNHNIVHRDIRLPNVILKENKEIALIDFGLARFIDHDRYFKEEDYRGIVDFLIFLYYTSYEETNSEERPWFEELDLNIEEVEFLKKLMGIEEGYKDIKEIRKQLNKVIEYDNK